MSIIGSKAIDLLVGKIADRLGEQLRPQLELIDQRLMRMEPKIERLLAIHLNAALIYLQSGDYQSARPELVKAVAADPYSAAAKFWYGITLYMNGQPNLGKNEIAKALLLNPFVGQNEEVPTYEIDTILETRAAAGTWILKLNDKKFLKQLPQPNWFSRLFTNWWGGGWGYQKFAAIVKVSCSAGYPVVFWRLGSNLFREYEYFVTALDLVSGACLWNERTRDQLCFATPRVVILRSTDPGNGYSLLDMKTGSVVAEMGAEYYRTVFSPNEEYLPQIGAFRRSNLKMSDSGPIVQRIHDELQKKGFLDRLSAHTDPIEDSGMSSSPFGGNPYTIQAVNKWNVHVDSGGGRMPPSSALGCDAVLSR
ncbi:MAG: tetratricopeptide repeat protein [Terriglobales bacterium]